MRVPMIAEYLHSIEGIEILGVAGLLLSFLLFCGMLAWAIRLKNDHLATMARLPLDSCDSDHSNSGTDV
jgi:hypothetical protein